MHESASQPPAPRLRDDTIALAWANAAPSRYRLDGELAEWPLPRASASSRMALTLTGDGLSVAAELAGKYRGGFLLGIAFDAPNADSLELGVEQPDGRFVPLACVADAGPDAECSRRLLDKRELLAAERLRFRRLYRVGPGGVELVGASGNVPVRAARVESRALRAHTTLELEIPARSLPRASEAPLARVALVVRALEGDVPADVAEWTSYEVSPVSFQPHAELRHALLAAGAGLMSYQPGEPLDIEELGHAEGSERLALKRFVGVLHDPEANVAGVEYCLVRLRETWLAVLAGTKVLGLERIGPEPRGTALRGNDLHVFQYQVGEHAFELAPDGRPWVHATWTIRVAKPDGTVLDAKVTGAAPERWVEPQEIGSQTFDSFGIRGLQPNPRDPRKPTPATAFWRVDPRGDYRVDDSRVKHAGTGAR